MQLRSQRIGIDQPCHLQDSVQQLFFLKRHGHEGPVVQGGHQLLLHRCAGDHRRQVCSLAPLQVQAGLREGNGVFTPGLVGMKLAIDDHRAILANLIQLNDQLKIGLVLPQVMLVLAGIVLAPEIFTLFDIPYGQLAMFRIAMLGALFQLFFMLLTVVLSYLDLNRMTLGLHALFLVTNLTGTLLSLHLGFAYYGYGYFLASVLSFLAACWITFRCLDQLPYHAFITGNRSIQ